MMWKYILRGAGANIYLVGKNNTINNNSENFRKARLMLEGEENLPP